MVDIALQARPVAARVEPSSVRIDPVAASGLGAALPFTGALSMGVIYGLLA